MHQIGVAIFFRGEREDERVGETLVMLFRADVGAPFQRGDFGDFLFQSAKIIFDGGDLLLGGGVLELEEDRVRQFAARGGLFSSGQTEGEQGEEAGDNDNIFHVASLTTFSGARQAGDVKNAAGRVLVSCAAGKISWRGDW